MFILVTLATILALQPKHAAGLLNITRYGHFNEWYPQFQDHFYNATHDNCSAQYDAYLYGPPQPHHPQAVASDLIQCILDASPYFTQAIGANMAAAAVLLGLLPTILAFVGSSTAEISLLGLRRPIFALCIATGAPATSPIRAHEYDDPIKKLLHGSTGQIDDIYARGLMKQWAKATVSILEFTLLGLALANVIELAMELGYRTVSSFAPVQTWLILFWLALAPVIHVCGIASLRAHVNIRRADTRGTRSIWQALAGWISDEIRPCADHDRWSLEEQRETFLFLMVSWCTALGTVFHIFYGTLVFSSLLFISVQDAVPVVARFLGSAAICRGLLMFELRGMRQAVSHSRRTSSMLLQEPQTFYLQDIPPPQERSSLEQVTPGKVTDRGSSHRRGVLAGWPDGQTVA